MRVSVSAAAGLERDFVRYFLENMLDAAFVMVQGRTVTLYRQRAHPRPPLDVIRADGGAAEDEEGYVGP